MIRCAQHSADEDSTPWIAQAPKRTRYANAEQSRDWQQKDTDTPRRRSDPSRTVNEQKTRIPESSIRRHRAHDSIRANQGPDDVEGGATLRRASVIVQRDVADDRRMPHQKGHTDQRGKHDSSREDPIPVQSLPSQ